MKKDADRIRTKGDGIRVIDHGKGPDRRALWAIAALIVVLLAMVWGRISGGSPTGPVPDETAALPGKEQSEERQRRQASVRPAKPVTARAPVTAREPAAASAPLLDEATRKRLVDGTAETAPERSEEEKLQQEKTARELLSAAVAAGENIGIAAFPPPGTDPIKVGLVVPRNFELPEGFLRHHQITDDGRRLEPILMFSPDYEFVDADGKPVAVPEDGIVPEEMAPPGLPLRVLAVPKKPYGP
jgi:hypothetical protein